MRPIGFSTGAIGQDDVDYALSCLRGRDLPCIEFSALRWQELGAVASRTGEAVSAASYSYVSFHAPSGFSTDQEPELVAFLEVSLPPDCIVVIHPDAITQPALWRRLGARIAPENMDRRKSTGRTAQELSTFFELLPEARFCFDVGHAQQWDPSMTEAYRMLRDFHDRLVQVHVSDVSTDSRHEQLSQTAIIAFNQIASMIAPTVPLIIESRVECGAIGQEIERVKQAFPLVGDRLAIA
jgi:hypothetical protein